MWRFFERKLVVEKRERGSQIPFLVDHNSRIRIYVLSLFFGIEVFLGPLKYEKSQGKILVFVALPLLTGAQACYTIRV